VLSAIKNKVFRASQKRIRTNLLKQIELKLFNVKGFHLKEIYLAEDNRTAIAIDSNYQSVNLISINKNSIKTCLVRNTDLLAARLIQNAQCFESLSRKSGLTHSQLDTVNSGKIVELIGDTFPSGARVLCLDTTKKNQPCFAIDFCQKDVEHRKNKKTTRSQAIHWFNICKNIILEGEKKAEEANYRQSFSRLNMAEEIAQPKSA